MSIYLRIILFAGALLASIYVMRKIRKSQMKIESAIYWIFFALLILLLSIFPSIGITIAAWIGIESPVNFIFLIFLFLILAKLFSLTVKISQLEYKLSILVEEIAIWRKHLEDFDVEKNMLDCIDKNRADDEGDSDE